MYYDYDEERYILDVPKECPECGSDLELDINYDTTYLYCTNNNCNYKIDVTDEFKELEEVENDEDEDDEEDDEYDEEDE